MKRLLLVLSALALTQIKLFTWTNGELLIWMDSDREYALGPDCQTDGDVNCAILVGSSEERGQAQRRNESRCRQRESDSSKDRDGLFFRLAQSERRNRTGDERA